MELLINTLLGVATIGAILLMAAAGLYLAAAMVNGIRSLAQQSQAVAVDTLAESVQEVTDAHQVEIDALYDKADLIDWSAYDQPTFLRQQAQAGVETTAPEVSSENEDIFHVEYTDMEYIEEVDPETGLPYGCYV